MKKSKLTTLLFILFLISFCRSISFSEEQDFNLKKGSGVNALNEALNSLNKKINFLQKKINTLEENKEKNLKNYVEKLFNKKLDKLKADVLEKWKPLTYEVLAAVRVEKGSIVSRTPGVSYNKGTGVVVFPNSRNKSFIPVVTDFNNFKYATDKHYLREITGADRFRVWRTTMDTTARNDSPESFTAIVIGF